MSGEDGFPLLSVLVNEPGVFRNTRSFVDIQLSHSDPIASCAIWSSHDP